jgi:hypothetical protein
VHVAGDRCEVAPAVYGSERDGAVAVQMGTHVAPVAFLDGVLTERDRAHRPAWCAGGRRAGMARPSSRRSRTSSPAGLPWDDPTLQIYRCRARNDEHYHLGHARGSRAKQLRRRAESLRRKELVKQLVRAG